MQDLTIPGQTIAYPVGRITITLQYVRPGAYTIELHQGTYRLEDLCSAHADERTARSRARSIAEALKGGISVEQLTTDRQFAMADALAQAAAIINAAAERTDAELVRDLNVDLDRYHAAYVAEADAIRAEVDAIVGRTLTDTVPAGTPTQVRPTLAGAHLTELTPPQHRAINAHRDGRIYAGQGHSQPTLKALDRKGYGTAVFEGRRRRIAYVVLTARGLAEVRQAVAA